jgi:hypothetical protein
MRTLSAAAIRSITTASIFTALSLGLSLVLWSAPEARAAAPATDPAALQPASQVGVDAPELARLGAARGRAHRAPARRRARRRERH